MFDFASLLNSGLLNGLGNMQPGSMPTGSMPNFAAAIMQNQQAMPPATGGLPSPASPANPATPPLASPPGSPANQGMNPDALARLRAAMSVQQLMGGGQPMQGQNGQPQQPGQPPMPQQGQPQGMPSMPMRMPMMPQSPQMPMQAQQGMGQLQQLPVQALLQRRNFMGGGNY